MSIDTADALDALIVGASGQDGMLLATLLASRGCSIHGVSRRPFAVHLVGKEIRHTLLDVRNHGELERLVRETSPDLLFYLAAYHHSSDDPRGSHSALGDYLEVNVGGLNAVLSAVRQFSPTTRVVYASSCHAFGRPDDIPQTERTPMRPVTLYGISKATGLSLCRHYRETHGLHASAAILYNHESRWRPRDFITAHLAAGAAEAATGRGGKTQVRDLDAVVDWCAAVDVVEALCLMAKAAEPDDYIVASGVARTVRDFASSAFGAVGLDWRDWVVVASPTAPRSGIGPYVGDATLIRERLGWMPHVKFDDLVREMVDQFFPAGPARGAKARSSE